MVSSTTRRFAGRGACRGPDDRLHQRRLRSAASRPRPVSAGGARAGRCADRGGQLGSFGPRARQGTEGGRINHRGRARRDAGGAGVCRCRGRFSTKTRRTRSCAVLQPDVLVKGADWAPGHHRRRGRRRGARRRVVRIPLAEGYSTSNLDREDSPSPVRIATVTPGPLAGFRATCRTTCRLRPLFRFARC